MHWWCCMSSNGEGVRAKIHSLLWFIYATELIDFWEVDMAVKRLFKMMQSFSVTQRQARMFYSFSYSTVADCVILGRLVSIDLNICKGVWCMAVEENWPSSVSLKFTSWRWVNQLCFSAPFLTHQGCDWVREYSPCAQLWLDESLCSSVEFLQGCQNHRTCSTYLPGVGYILEHWVIPSQGVVKMLSLLNLYTSSH